MYLPSTAPESNRSTSVREHARTSRRGRIGRVARHQRRLKSRERQIEKWEADHEVIGRIAFFGPHGHSEAKIYRNGQPSTFVNPAFAQFAKAGSWHHTDAWRGHYDLPPRVGDWERVLDTWVSPQGHMGDYQTLHQVPIEKLYAAWKAGERPPFPVTVVLLRTSNVFSNTIGMFVRKQDVTRMKELLATAGVDPRDSSS